MADSMLRNFHTEEGGRRCTHWRPASAQICKPTQSSQEDVNLDCHIDCPWARRLQPGSASSEGKGDSEGIWIRRATATAATSSPAWCYFYYWGPPRLSSHREPGCTPQCQWCHLPSLQPSVLWGLDLPIVLAKNSSGRMSQD